MGGVQLGYVLYVLLCVARETSAGTYIEAETGVDKSAIDVVAMNDKGVVIAGRDSLVMQVKACSGAILVLSQIHNIKLATARYFFLSLGTGANNIKDTCFAKCLRPSSSVKGYWLDCNSFKTFWLSWDSTGALRLGNGSAVGRHVLMQLRTPKPFLVNFLHLLGQRNHVKWRFIQDSPPEFVFPDPRGGTVVEIPEDTGTKKVVFELKAHDPDMDMVHFSVSGEFSDIFQCSGSLLLLMKSLDYETRSRYTLHIVAKDEFNTVTAVLIVVVTDVNDNYPVIGSIRPVRVPEELPVGSVVGAITSAHDVDTGDKLTYSLSGSGARYFTVAPQTGVLYVRKGLDLDKVNQQTLGVSLAVRDAAQHKTVRGFNITVYNINDNPPSFSQRDYNVTVREGGEGVKSLVKFSVRDPDDRDSENVTLSLLRPVRGFWLDGKSLLVNSSLLDCDESGADLRHYLLVLAVDEAWDGRQNTGTAAVTVQVEPLNEYGPVWAGHGNSSHPDLTFAHTQGSGEATPTLLATDRDAGQDGQIKYRLISVDQDSVCLLNGTFAVDAETGRLSLADPVPECPNCTVRLQVEARDLGVQSRAVVGWVSLQLWVEHSPLNDTVAAMVRTDTVVTEHLHLVGNSIVLERKIFYTITGIIEVKNQEKTTLAIKSIVNCSDTTSVTDAFSANNVDLVTETVVSATVVPKNVKETKKTKPHGSNSITQAPGHTQKSKIMKNNKIDHDEEDSKTTPAHGEANSEERDRWERTGANPETVSAGCESSDGVLLLQTMLGILGFCLLISVCLIICHKRTPVFVRPDRLECEGCQAYPQIAPVSTKEGSYFST